MISATIYVIYWKIRNSLLSLQQKYLLKNGVSGQDDKNMARSAQRSDEGGLSSTNLIGWYIVSGAGDRRNWMVIWKWRLTCPTKAARGNARKFRTKVILLDTSNTAACLATKRRTCCRRVQNTQKGTPCCRRCQCHCQKCRIIKTSKKTQPNNIIVFYYYLEYNTRSLDRKYSFSKSSDGVNW
jgi:hypothetical protein